MSFGRLAGFIVRDPLRPPVVFQRLKVLSIVGWTSVRIGGNSLDTRASALGLWVLQRAGGFWVHLVAVFTLGPPDLRSFSFTVFSPESRHLPGFVGIVLILW